MRRGSRKRKAAPTPQLLSDGDIEPGLTVEVAAVCPSCGVSLPDPNHLVTTAELNRRRAT